MRATDRSAERRVLVSAGGTREPLDSVRYVGNRSSGRMGVALAEEARSRGAEVTLLAANLAVPAPAGVDGRRDADGSRPRARGTRTRPDADVIVMAAAVADYRAVRAVARPSGRRTESPWPIELEPTTDVLAAIGTVRRARSR